MGYQPALSPTRRLVAAELVPSHLLSTLVSDEDVNGFRLDALSLDVENLWTEAYSRIRAG